MLLNILTTLELPTLSVFYVYILPNDDYANLLLQAPGQVGVALLQSFMSREGNSKLHFGFALLDSHGTSLSTFTLWQM